MDQTLQALGGLLLNALPTLFLILVLHFYLKAVFFTPLEKVLHQREQATEGARGIAEARFESAHRKAQEYEAAIRDARSEIYREQEQLRRRLRDEQAEAIRQAREKARAMVETARAQLSGDVEATRAALASHSEALSEQIAHRILSRSAHA